jgi:outer membrane protein assembly factor BamB
MARLGGAAVAALLAMTASGCWLQAGYGAGKGGYNDREDTVTAATVAGLEEAWSATLPTAGREPLVSGDTVVVRTSGAVTALDLATGAQRWSAAIGGDDAPAIVEGELRVPSDGATCTLVSLDLADGAQLGRRPYGFYGIVPPPSPATSTVCSTTDALGLGGKVVVTAASYITTIAPNCGFVSASTDGISFLDYAATPQNGEHGHHAAGPCSTTSPPPLPPPPTPSEPPTAAGDVVLRPDSAQGSVTAYPAACSPSCSPAWVVDTPTTFLGPVVALPGGDAAVAAADGTVVVIDGTTHAVDWTATAGAPVSRPVAADDRHVFALTGDGRLLAFPVAGCAAPTCPPAWEAALPAPGAARASIGGDVVYVGLTDGTVAAFAADGCGTATCGPLWSGSVGAPVAAPPVVSDGALLVASSDGTVTAFSL